MIVLTWDSLAEARWVFLHGGISVEGTHIQTCEEVSTRLIKQVRRHQAKFAFGRLG